MNRVPGTIMNRVIVNLAIGSRRGQSYAVGQARLLNALAHYTDDFEKLRFYTNGYPLNSPTHAVMPFAFKAYAMKEASAYGNLLMWLDSCIIPVQSLEPIWNRASIFGVWMGKNGYKNSEWTAESAMSDLFPGVEPKKAREMNMRIEHVVATAFALDTKHPNGAAFLKEYFRLASETRAFYGDGRGPAGSGAHRHDQTAASVIMWRLGLTASLTASPELFAYKGDETEKTVLVADGKY